MVKWLEWLHCMQEVCNSNPPVITGFSDPEKISSVKPSNLQKKLKIVKRKKTPRCFTYDFVPVSSLDWRILSYRKKFTYFQGFTENKNIYKIFEIWIWKDLLLKMERNRIKDATPIITDIMFSQITVLPCKCNLP